MNRCNPEPARLRSAEHRQDLHAAAQLQLRLAENYVYVNSGNETVNQYIARIDREVNETNQLAVHFMYTFRNFPDADPAPAFKYTGTYPIYNSGLQYIHILSPKPIDELRLGTDLEHVKQLSTLADHTLRIQPINLEPGSRSLDQDCGL